MGGKEVGGGRLEVGINVEWEDGTENSCNGGINGRI